MENQKQQLDALQDIRKMMKESSKFISLSGLSGIFAGIYALIGAYLGHLVISGFPLLYARSGEYNTEYKNVLIEISAICFAVLVLSIVTAFFFSYRKAKKMNQKIFDHTSKKLLWSIIVPLFAGGMFCLALLYHGGGLIVLGSPIMLLFYGMALVNGSKYTMHDLKYLGYLEIVLGITASFLLGYELIFWALGFGVLHIIYGVIMWFKYDRNL